MKDNSPILLFGTENWMVAKVIDKDDYRLGVYLERINQSSIWRVTSDTDLSCTLEELRELHGLIGRILDGESDIPYPG